MRRDLLQHVSKYFSSERSGFLKEGVDKGLSGLPTVEDKWVSVDNLSFGAMTTSWGSLLCQRVTISYTAGHMHIEEESKSGKEHG